ncbi:hypothetical protein KIPB_001184, partial [Kipferlia bialata]|eukprot:g1184.t1
MDIDSGERPEALAVIDVTSAPRSEPPAPSGTPGRLAPICLAPLRNEGTYDAGHDTSISPVGPASVAVTPAVQ